jgi:hypothetical protein
LLYQFFRLRVEVLVANVFLFTPQWHHFLPSPKLQPLFSKHAETGGWREGGRFPPKTRNETAAVKNSKFKLRKALVPTSGKNQKPSGTGNFMNKRTAPFTTF